jgi:putative Mg2+ transporter-C (MgtC) family protein
VGITMTLAGPRVLEAGRVLAVVDGVTRIDQLHDDSD